jgi:site-specific DNA-methyltransferase (adenine-specific)
MAVRIEDAGFEIRDMIAWVYGSGFPKSLDVSKAIDKNNGHWRGKAGGVVSGNDAMSGGNYERTPKGEPIHPEAKQWQGWGTALKPALEPITVARKPLIGTVAENVLQHGTGAINVDGGRVASDSEIKKLNQNRKANRTIREGDVAKGYGMRPEGLKNTEQSPLGRWPANFIHDGSEEATDLLGASARFFYCAKASKADRGENHHPTVKPTDLMRYLCRLVTPPSGIVLDPFMGSGSTGKAAMLEGFAFVGIEREAEYIDIAKARIQSAVGLL